MATVYESMTVRGRNGAFQQYQSNGEQYTPGTGIRERVSDSAARIASAGKDEEAKALGRFGKAFRDAVHVGIKAYDDYSKSKATQLITEYRRNMNTYIFGAEGLLSKQGEDALNIEDLRVAESDRLKQELLKDTNAYTQRYFHYMADDYDTEASLRTQKYARGQHITMLNRNDSAAAEERGEYAIFNYKNGQEFDKGVGQGLFHQRAILVRQGYSGEALARGLKEYTSKIFRSAITNALAVDDVASANRLLAQGSKIHSVQQSGQGMQANGQQPGQRNQSVEQPENKGFFDSVRSGLSQAADKVTNIAGQAVDKVEYAAAKTGQAVKQAFTKDEEGKPTQAKDGEGKPIQTAEGKPFGSSIAIQGNGQVGSPIAIQGNGQAEFGKIGDDVKRIFQEQEQRQAQPAQVGYARMTATDVAWANDAIRRKREAIHNKAIANANKAEREILKGYKDSRERAELLGDFEPLRQKEAQLRAIGRTDKADQVRKVISSLEGMKESIDSASSSPIHDVEQQLKDIGAEIEEAKQAKDLDKYKKAASKYKKIAKIYDSRVKKLNDDPAAAVEQERSFQLPDNATEEDRICARLEAQARNGVATPQPLTKSEVELLSTNYQKAENKPAYLNQLRERYGDQAPNVIQQLIESKKVSKNVRFSMDMSPEASALLHETEKKDYVTGLEKTMNMDSGAKKSLQESVYNELEEITKTFLHQGAADVANDAMKATYNLALQYKAQGKDDDDAAELAAKDVIKGRYTISRSGTYRIPVKYNAEIVQIGAKAELKKVASSGRVTLPNVAGYNDEQRKKMASRIIETNGTWVTNEDESGLFLTVNGRSVYDTEGQRIEISFDELEEKERMGEISPLDEMKYF